MKLNFSINQALSAMKLICFSITFSCLYLFEAHFSHNGLPHLSHFTSYSLSSATMKQSARITLHWCFTSPHQVFIIFAIINQQLVLNLALSLQSLLYHLSVQSQKLVYLDWVQTPQWNVLGHVQLLLILKVYPYLDLFYSIQVWTVAIAKIMHYYGYLR